MFDPDGDFARYLMSIPLPDLDPVATPHFAGLPLLPSDFAPQQAPVMLPNAAAPLGIDATQFQYQAPAMDIQIQPPQMLPPAEQAYGYIPELPLAAATGVGFDALPSFDEGMFLDAPAGGIPSLYDGEDEFSALFRDLDQVGAAAGEPAMEVELAVDVPPVEEDPIFVPFVPGQLDCTNCRTVRELLHESANHMVYLTLHGGADHGTFHHAITLGTHIGSDGQFTMDRQMYLDLHQRSQHWVESFIANCAEVLRNDSSGQLKDSWSTSGASASRNIVTTTLPAVNNDAHMELEIDMLKKILSTASTNDEAPAPQDLEAPHRAITLTPQEIVENLQQGNGISSNNAASGHELNLPILDSYNSDLNVQDEKGPSSVAEWHPSLAQQRKRIAGMSMADAVNLMHMTRGEAAKLLNISCSSLKRLCKRNGLRWPGRKINSLNSKIKKLEEAAARNRGRRGMLAIKEKLEEVMLERAQLYASIMHGANPGE